MVLSSREAITIVGNLRLGPWVRQALILGLLALFGPATAGALSDENVVTPVPAGFLVGRQANSGPMTIGEYVPAGETVKNWSSMITVQVFHNLRAFEPDVFAEGVRTQWLAACAGSEVHKIKDGVENGYRYSLWMFNCPLNTATGKPETMFTKITSGADGLYSVQYAYRSVLTAEMISPTMRYLGSVLVCDTRLPDRPCPPGM